MASMRLAQVAGIATVLFLAASGLGASAGKPADVVAWSNGFPSGEHYNLNLHGKKAGFACDGSAGGASVFVPEYGDAQVQYVQNKRSSVSGLTVHDACAGFDGDAALVQLPAGTYQVYARILAKPAKADAPREVLFHPQLVEACNDSGTENFTDAVSCEESFLLGTGVLTTGGAFTVDGQSLARSAGRSKAVDVTKLFQWTGWACDQSVDLDGDGQIGLGDVSADQDGDGDIDDADLAAYLAAVCVHHDDAWVFDIADLVVYGWDYQNNGSKLVQVRFYPVASTTFA